MAEGPEGPMTLVGPFLRVLIAAKQAERRETIMDPDKALQIAREAVVKLHADLPFEKDRDDVDDAAGALADAFEALDGWLSKGGFLPKAWTILPNGDRR